MPFQLLWASTRSTGRIQALLAISEALPYPITVVQLSKSE
jgi:hypothetical protein